MEAGLIWVEYYPLTIFWYAFQGQEFMFGTLWVVTFVFVVFFYWIWLVGKKLWNMGKEFRNRKLQIQ